MLSVLLLHFQNFAWVGTNAPWFNITPTESGEILVVSLLRISYAKKNISEHIYHIQNEAT
jgi:hypothetical protein